MGQKLCCLRPSAAEPQPQPINASRKTMNLRENNRTRRAESNKMMTLEECLKNSPAAAANHRPQPKKRVFPSTSSPDSGNSPFFTPRLSFSTATTSLLGKNVEAAQPCRSFGRREKSNKKVTFRLPVEDDIILFYSPKQAFDTLMEIND